MSWCSLHEINKDATAIYVLPKVKVEVEDRQTHTLHPGCILAISPPHFKRSTIISLHHFSENHHHQPASPFISKTRLSTWSGLRHRQPWSGMIPVAVVMHSRDWRLLLPWKRSGQPRNDSSCSPQPFALGLRAVPAFETLMQMKSMHALSIKKSCVCWG